MDEPQDGNGGHKEEHKKVIKRETQFVAQRPCPKDAPQRWTERAHE